MHTSNSSCSAAQSVALLQPTIVSTSNNTAVSVCVAIMYSCFFCSQAYSEDSKGAKVGCENAQKCQARGLVPKFHAKRHFLSMKINAQRMWYNRCAPLSIFVFLVYAPPKIVFVYYCIIYVLRDMPSSELSIYVSFFP